VLGVIQPTFAGITTQLSRYIWGGALIYLLWAYDRTQRRRKLWAIAYCRALQNERPEQLVSVLEAGRRRSPTDAETAAVFAKGLAYAYAVYGDEDKAREALRKVDWAKKPPLVQALGVQAEALVALLCNADAQGALRLSERARALSAVSVLIPGAAQNRKFLGIFVAVCEAHLGKISDQRKRWMQEALVDQRDPILQALSAWGLAIEAESEGDSRAKDYRVFISKLAPHCRVFQMSRKEFARARHATDSELERAVTIEQEGLWKEYGTNLLIRKLGVQAGLCLFFILMFLAIWLFVSPHQ
jgi:hypothetical protein